LIGIIAIAVGIGIRSIGSANIVHGIAESPKILSAAVNRYRVGISIAVAITAIANSVSKPLAIALAIIIPPIAIVSPVARNPV
jgi:hypothetical protein